jgi:hypothetical protein
MQPKCMRGAAGIVCDDFCLSSLECVYGGMILQLNLLILHGNRVQGLPGLVYLTHMKTRHGD